MVDPRRRRWRGFMSDEAVELELPVALSEAQYEWLVATRIPVRSMRCAGDASSYLLSAGARRTSTISSHFLLTTLTSRMLLPF